VLVGHLHYAATPVPEKQAGLGLGLDEGARSILERRATSSRRPTSLDVTTDQLIVDEGERGPDDELRLQFHDVRQFPRRTNTLTKPRQTPDRNGQEPNEEPGTSRDSERLNALMDDVCIAADVPIPSGHYRG